MVVIPAAVVLILAFAIANQEIPLPVIQRLEIWLPNDGSPGELILVVACAVGAVLSFTPFDRVAKYLSTAVHELGHVLMASLLGGRPKNIHISVSGAGLATYLAPAEWGRMRSTAVSFAGYPAPAVAALAGVRAVQGGYSRAWFVFATTVLGLSILFLIRNLWGFIWTTLVVVASASAAKYLNPEILGVIASGVVGYLIVESLQNAQIQISILRSQPGSGCDAEQVGAKWGISSKVVGYLHFLVVLTLSGLTVFYALRPLWL